MLTNKDHIKLLLEKYLADDIFDPELRELLHLIEGNTHDEDWEELLMPGMLSVSRTVEYDKASWEPVIEYVLGRKVSPAPVRRMAIFRRVWVRYAAAIIIIASAAIATIDMFSNRPSGADAPSKNIVVTEILPGTNRAILTVDNQIIELSSEKTGIAVNNSITYSDGEKLMDAGQELQLATPKGGQYQLTLPDGTKAWLNAASSIRFPSQFASGQRKIKITGEVYLEVARNKKKPFIVDVDGKSFVEVLGTRFNINSYADDGTIRTTLMEGSVKVSKINSIAGAAPPDRQPGSRRVDNSLQSLILAPGQQAMIDVAGTTGGPSGKNSKAIVISSSVDLGQVLAWKNGLFNFNGSDLHVVMSQLERWYDIEVRYEGNVPDIQFGGELSRDLTLSQAILILSEMEVKFRIEGRVLIVENK